MCCVSACLGQGYVFLPRSFYFFVAGKQNKEKITRIQEKEQYHKKREELWQQLALEALQKRCRERVAKYNAMLAADIEEKKKKEEEKKLKIKKMKELKSST